MFNQRNPSRVKAALTGAFLCASLGPTLGAAGLVGRGLAHDQHPLIAAVELFSSLPFVLPFAVMMVGPGALVLGGLGALVIQRMSVRVRSAKALVLATSILGLVFGAAVPLVSDLVFAAFQDHLNFATDFVPLGAITGLVCAIAVYWLLRRMRLLRVQRSIGSEALSL